MRILVTGAAGFIGYHLARRLLADGARVTGLDSFDPYYDPRLKEARFSLLQQQGGFTGMRGDLAGAAALDAVGAGEPIDAVVHLAAQTGVRYSLTNPGAYVQSNLVGFANVLEFCRRRQVAHLLFASSSSVYGLSTRTPLSVTHNVDHPVSLYAATKKANELMAHSYSHLYGLPATGLRFFTVYGPWGRPDMAYFKFTEAILAGRPIEVFNHGNLWRDFTYIDDVVEGMVRLLRQPPRQNPSWDAEHPHPGSSSAPYRLYNIGNHRPVKLTDFIRTLEQVLGRTAILENREMQPGDVFSTHADTTELRAATGFEPSTELTVGLAKFAEWYRQYYRV